ncbi:MAG: GumC family protein [Planctomycetota bacterium]
MAEIETRHPVPDPSPGQALAFLWRGRWLIAGLTLAAAAAGTWLAEQRGTIWRARSMLYVERESPLMPGNDVSLWVQSRNYANTQAALLRSAPVLEAALAAFGPRPLFGDATNHLAWLQRNLKIAVGAQDELITVSLDSPALDDACDLVNDIVDTYLAFHADNNRETASAVLTDLTAQLERYEAELQAVHAEQVEFLRTHPGVGPSQDAGLLAAERYRELNNALTRAEIDAVEAEAAWKAAKSMAASAELLRQLPLTSGGVFQPRPAQTEIQQLRERLQQLLTAATREHPEVQRLEQRIAAAEREAQTNDTQVAEGYVALLEHRLAGAREKVADLRAKVAEHERQVLEVNPAQAEYRAIEVRYERARKVADVLYDRVRTLDINERLDAARKVELNAMVYERATPSGSTVASSKRTLVAIATFLGLVLATGIAWLRSLVDQRLRTPEEVAALVPLLATLPRVGRGASVRETWSRRPAFAAAMRSLRTVLQFGVRSERCRVLQITAPVEHPGRTLVAAGLGVAMAQAGQRILLVDADLRGAQLAATLGVTARDGLRQVLDRRVEPAAAIAPTPIPNLFVLPAGAGPGNAIDPQLDEHLATTLATLRPDFDRILVDSPPLLLDNDARVVAAVCDETLLLVRSGHTTRKAVLSALSLVAAVAGRIAGAVLAGTKGAAAIGVADVHSLRGPAGPTDRLLGAKDDQRGPGRTTGTR